MKIRTGATLIELILVVLILGIIAAVAAPRVLNVSRSAAENGQRQSLEVMRGAIECFQAENDHLPGQAKNSDAFKAELSPHLRSEFPTNLFDDNGKKADVVKFRDKGEPLVDHVGGDEGWLYDTSTGEIIANTSDVSSDGVTPYSQF